MMSKQLQHLLFMCSVINIQIYKGTSAECHFPDYIQSPIDENGEPMPWQTKVWWLNLRNDPKLREMQEVYVYRSQIWSQRQNNRWSCDRMSRRLQNRATSVLFGNCSEKYLLYNRTCLIEERFNRFRVVQHGPGRNPTFVCMQFVKRSDNVIQIMEGPAKESNHGDICDEELLQLEEWPWIAAWRREVMSCPISGGFSFRTINRLTNEDFCEDEWRQSRLEIDCSKGDGLNFIAPKGSRCNPFSSKHEVSKFYCWAGWEENNYKFLVIGENKGVPQYCLRFPSELTEEFTVIVYFSVLCPLQADGMPPTGMEYHEMRMTALNADNCIDDDPVRCQAVQRRGQCKKEEKFGVHCELSCGKCEQREDLLNMQCPFSSMLHGSWLFEDKYHKEHVLINQTVAQFSDLGTFICKERSASSDKLYKTVSMFNNGCAMRYTCFEFDRKNNNVLQFRVGKSYRTDSSYDTMCKFETNKLTGADTYRGNTMKNLILDGRLWDAYCGFSGDLPFNGTIYGEPCAGQISDWDSDACVTRGVLNIHSDTCKNLRIPMEYQCLVFIAHHPLEQFIITKSLESGEFNCWVLTGFLCEDWEWGHRALYKLDSPQCVTLAESACIIDNTPEALLYLHDEEKTKHCKPIAIPPTPGEHFEYSTKQPSIDNLPYNFPENEEPTIHQMEGRGQKGSFGESMYSSAVSIMLSYLYLSIALPIFSLTLMSSNSLPT